MIFIVMWLYAKEISRSGIIFLVTATFRIPTMDEETAKNFILIIFWWNKVFANM